MIRAPAFLTKMPRRTFKKRPATALSKKQRQFTPTSQKRDAGHPAENRQFCGIRGIQVLYFERLKRAFST